MLKNLVIQELSKIATILAAATVDWGGKDEARAGRPGRIDKTLAEVLEKLPVTWEKDKAEFTLAQIRELDEKSKSGVKTWVRASLPGKYNEKEFTFKIYRTGKVTQYTFQVDSEVSPKITSSSKIEELFYHFFKVEETKLTSETLGLVNDTLYAKKNELHKILKKYMSEFIISPALFISRDTDKNYIFLKLFAPKSNIKDIEKAKITPEDIKEIISEISEFLNKIEGVDLSKIKITANFKEATFKGDEGYLLQITLKF